MRLSMVSIEFSARNIDAMFALQTLFGISPFFVFYSSSINLIDAKNK